MISIFFKKPVVNCCLYYKLHDVRKSCKNHNKENLSGIDGSYIYTLFMAYNG